MFLILIRLEHLTLNREVVGHRVVRCGAEPRCSWVEPGGGPGVPSLGRAAHLPPSSPELWTGTQKTSQES